MKNIDFWFATNNLATEIKVICEAFLTRQTNLRPKLSEKEIVEIVATALALTLSSLLNNKIPGEQHEQYIEHLYKKIVEYFTSKVRQDVFKCIEIIDEECRKAGFEEFPTNVEYIFKSKKRGK